MQYSKISGCRDLDLTQTYKTYVVCKQTTNPSETILRHNMTWAFVDLQPYVKSTQLQTILSGLFSTVDSSYAFPAIFSFLGPQFLIGSMREWS